jgi:arginyl-tRNA synthetase
MNLEKVLIDTTLAGIKALYDADIDASKVQLQKTKKEFEGDQTVVVFPLAGMLRQNPMKIGEELGEYITAKCDIVVGYNLVKGFLNLSIDNSYWMAFFNDVYGNERFGYAAPTGELKMVEYSSPNTNKPLHLGHLRNNFLGYSMAEILKANGHDVQKVQIINDRGIHICMSMYAWQQWGNGETPESSGVKGDHLVGKYYVRFNTAYKEETQAVLYKWAASDFDGVPSEVADKYEKLLAVIANDEKSEKDKKTAQGAMADLAKNQTAIIGSAREMLLKWEQGDEEVVTLWKTMNQWCYDGFDVTYKTMGVDFDKLYYESDTYLLGRDIAKDGVKSGLFFKKEDGSIWADLKAEGLDEKLLLRGNGTAVYMTQDIGTAILRFEDFPKLSGLIYTVANEQDHHFRILFEILNKLGMPWAKECFHLSYGMMELPHGRMKSREGTVVDADDLMVELFDAARAKSEEAEIQVDGMSEDEKQAVYRQIGLGALKYYILKVDPTRKMVYNPEESIDINGNTGPYIQMAYARSRSVLAKYGKTPAAQHSVELEPSENALLQHIYGLPATIGAAAENYSPAIIANYTFDLVKLFNVFWHEVPILKTDDAALKDFRVALTLQVGQVVKTGMTLLGIEVPERM